MPKKTIVLTRTVDAAVFQYLGSASSGCHGYQGLYQNVNGAMKNISIPGWDLPPGTEARVEIKVTVTKLGKRSKKRCENPWPGHRCDDGKHCGSHGKRTIKRTP